jgi:hypothetical protein
VNGEWEIGNGERKITNGFEGLARRRKRLNTKDTKGMKEKRFLILGTR